MIVDSIPSTSWKVSGKWSWQFGDIMEFFEDVSRKYNLTLQVFKYKRGWFGLWESGVFQLKGLPENIRQAVNEYKKMMENPWVPHY